MKRPTIYQVSILCIDVLFFDLEKIIFKSPFYCNKEDLIDKEIDSEPILKDPHYYKTNSTEIINI